MVVFVSGHRMFSFGNEVSLSPAPLLRVHVLSPKLSSGPGWCSLVEARQLALCPGHLVLDCADQ